MVGDSNLEVLNILPPQVYLPFESLPSGCIRLRSASLNEVIQLPLDLGAVPLEIGYQALFSVQVFIKDQINNLREGEVACHWSQKQIH